MVEPGTFTTSSLWFADRQLLTEARVLWRSMAEDVREEYGKDYFEFKVKQLDQFSKAQVSFLLSFSCA